MKWCFISNKIKEILGNKNKLYKCEYCGGIARGDITISALPPLQQMKQYFCCKTCKELYIDTLLPPEARRY